MRRPSFTFLAVLATLSWLLVATDSSRADEAADFALCHQATAAAERMSGVPDQLLDAISRVETGRYDKNQGSIRAWPWTINAEGQGHFYASKAEAVEAATEFRARGIQSMDVGCTQINLMFHPDAFGSLQDAFDPGRNATYAAHFLTELFHQAGSWPHAAAAYHSQTPELGTDYQHKVLEAWADPRGTAAGEATRVSFPHAAQPRRELAALASGRQGGGSAPFLASSRPFGRSPTMSTGGSGHPFNGGGHAFHGGGLTGVSGRALSAYRAMPVAMLTTSPRSTRY